MSDLEGHDEGQTPPETDPNGDGAVAVMTEEEIAERIDSDAEFAAKVNDGEIDVTKPIPKESEGKPEPEAAGEGDETAPVPDTPAEEGKPEGEDTEPPAEETLPAEDKEFTVKQSELGGYKTPGEAAKAIVEKEGHIGFLSNRIDALKDQSAYDKAEIERLQAQLAEKTAAKSGPQSDNTAGAGSDDPEKAIDKTGDDGDIDPYDPEYLKSIGKTAGQIQEVMQLVKSLEAKVTSQEQKGQQRAKVDAEFKDLTAFQTAHPEFKTEKPFQTIDAEYKKFIENIGVLAKTDGTFKQNMGVVNQFFNDKTERGDNIRKAAEANGIKLPVEFDKYNAVLTYRFYSGQYHKQDPVTSKMVPFSLEETYQFLNRDKEGGPRPNPTPTSDESEKNRKIQEEADKRKKKFAADVPPDMSGTANSVDSMSEDEQAAMLDTPIEELKRNPAKLQIVNEIYRRLGQPPLNVHGLQG